MTGRISLFLTIVLFACSPGSGGTGSGADVGALPDGHADAVVDDQGSADAATGDAVGGTVIGPEGGTVTGPGGALVEVPEGALEEDLEIAITAAADGPDDFIGLGPVFAFTPHGAEFLLPVAVTLPYDSDIMPGAEARVYWADTPEGDWEPLDSIANPAAGRVRAEVTHFSFGGAGASAVSCAGDPHVDDLGDGGDKTVADGICEAEGGGCTLRAAIQQSNGCKGTQTITFADFGEDAIVPKRSLSPIAGPTILQGSDVYGERPVWIYGAGAGAGSDTHGLTITSDEVVIRGLRVTDFYGDGIHADIAADAVIEIHDVEIVDNCGWGIRSGGIVDLGMGGTTPIPDQASAIRNNGTFLAECRGGGILAWRSGARVGGAELRHNGATGILAQGNVQVASVVVSQNTGDGIRSHGGSVLVSTDPSKMNDAVQIAFNEGNGIYAGGAGEPGDDPEDPEEDPDGVHVEHRTDIASNAGWGILSRGKTVLGRVEGGAAIPDAGSVTGNGAGPTCYEPPYEGVLEADPVFLEHACGGGGVMNSTDTPTSVEGMGIGGNAGTGILAYADLSLGAVYLGDNEGDGARAQNGAIEWAKTDAEGDPDRVEFNRGFGLWAWEFIDDDDEGLAVTISAPVEVLYNGRWGILATGGISLGSADGVWLPGRSKVDNNGHDNGESCFQWTIEEAGDVDALMEEVPCEGGGLVSTNGKAFVVNTELDFNAGPGVLADETVTLRGVHIFDNAGAGVRSMSGGVEIGPSGDTGNTISGNSGYGIRAAGSCPLDDCFGVRIQWETDVEGNDSIGIEAGDHGVVVGYYDGALITKRSAVSWNGAGDTCFEWSLIGTGDKLPEREEVECDFGGIYAFGADGDLTAARLDVQGNSGEGIEVEGDVTLEDSTVTENVDFGVVAGGDLTMDGGTLCDNGEGDYEVAGDVDLQGVTICSRLDEPCDDTHPCIQMLTCEHNPFDGKSYCLKPCTAYLGLCDVESDESDACCWGIPCTGGGPLSCATWSEGLPCTLDKQCDSGHCEGGVCGLQTEGEPCQHDPNCDVGLVCHQGACQDCDGTDDWCGECCPGMECGAETQKCCKPADWDCTQDWDCCSGDCDLYVCT